MRFRWTIKELKEHSDLSVLVALLNERMSDLNREAPLYKRLAKIRDKMENGTPLTTEPGRSKEVFASTFFERINAGQYDTDDGQFKADLLSHFGHRHEKTFDQLCRKHGESIGIRTFLHGVLTDFLKSVT